MIASMYYSTIFTMVVFVTIFSISCQGFSVMIQSQSSRAQTQRIFVGVSTPASSSSSSSSLQMIFGRGNKNKNDNDVEETQFIPGKKMNVARRKKLGIDDDEEEYDLGMALENSTDPFISKLIAGSLIVSITTLLIYAIVIPATTDYGEGVCNTLLTGGRC
jgi:hypothetical protein